MGETLTYLLGWFLVWLLGGKKESASVNWHTALLRINVWVINVARIPFRIKNVHTGNKQD